jgi:transcriptional regulator with XRE-family HTH domain
MEPARDMEPLCAVIGRQLRRIRVERGLSRKAVAARLGLAAERVGAHERGAVRLEARELVAYVRFYGVSISELFREMSADTSVGI